MGGASEKNFYAARIRLGEKKTADQKIRTFGPATMLNVKWKREQWQEEEYEVHGYYESYGTHWQWMY